MAFNMRNIGDNAIGSIIGALALGILGFVGGSLSREQIIDALGGVTKKEMNDEIGKMTASLGIYNSYIPVGAVIAFSTKSGCPANWSLLEESMGRTLVGATPDDIKFPNFDKKGMPLTKRDFREIGGEENHLLSGNEVPRTPVFIGDNTDYKAYYFATREPLSKIQFNSVNNNSTVGLISTKLGDAIPANALDSYSGRYDAKPFNLMPPYISLFFCKKNAS